METYIVTVYDNRTEWRNEAGELHRVNGPALEYANGNKYWYLNGQRHRTDGPAVEYATGDKFWYLNGELHNPNGPAIVRASGNKYWYLDGIELSEEEVNQRINSCNGKVVELDGQKYSLKLL